MFIQVLAECFDKQSLPGKKLYSEYKTEFKKLKQSEHVVGWTFHGLWFQSTFAK